MTNDERMTNDECPRTKEARQAFLPSSFVLRHSFVIRHSSFVIWLTVLVWTTIVLAISIRGLLQARANSVYPIFADAARHFLAGADLYGANGSAYRYSPLVAALFVPFSLCPD